MEQNTTGYLSVSITINQSLDKVWESWNDEKQMSSWMFTTEEFEIVHPKNDLRIGGGYSYKMVSKTSDIAFEYGGTYTIIDFKKYIAFTLLDNRKAEIIFSVIEDVVHIEVRFEPVMEQDVDVQLNGWQALLNHFKNHVEAQLN